MKLHNIEEIFDEIQSSEIPNQEILLTNIIETVGDVKRSSDELLKISTKVLANTQNQKMSITNESNVPDLPDVDPGKRSSKLTDSQKEYLIAVGPDQPVLSADPNDAKICEEGHKQARFNPGWYKEYPHLEYSLAKDAAFCFVCFLFHSTCCSDQAENSWHKDGVRGWHNFKSRGKQKKGKLAQHFSSQTHKNVVFAYANFLQKSSHVDVLLSKEKRMELIQQNADMLQNRKIVEILLDVAKTLGRQGIAFRGETSDRNGNFYQIVHLIARHCPDLKQWLNNARLRPYHVTYMSAQSQSEFILLIGNQVQQKVIKEIQHAGMFAVIADTTPDVPHKDRLALACCYVDHEGQPRERLLSLTEAKDKTGGGTADEIIQSITANGLKTRAVCFQSYDYTASISCQFKGAQKKLQEKLERNVPYMPCLAHRTNTVVEHSCNASPIVKELFNVLEAVYVF